ncbi:MAG TPA: hypothetical protein PLD62_08700 [Candidatus Cloacimonadota bacterium]|nr:hypothetical protein [Candidatus Cloacimonadota bacterium]
MIFKKKPAKVTWKSQSNSFTVYINGKELSGDIPNGWVGNDLLIYLEKEDKQYLLFDFALLQDNTEREADYIAKGETILWSKQDDGYFLFVNGMNVNQETESFWLDDLFLVKYQDKAYYLDNYSTTEDNVLHPAMLASDSTQSTWVKVMDHFYILHGGSMLDLNYDGNYCENDLLVYVDALKALVILINYRTCNDIYFAPVYRVARMNEFVYKKAKTGGYFLYINDKALHANAIATYHYDDIVVYEPEKNTTFILPNIRHDPGDDFKKPIVMPTEETAFWSAKDKSFYLIDKGENISTETDSHNSIIDDDLLVYNPSTSTTYLFEDYMHLKDGKLRPATVLSRSAQVVWKAYQNRYWIWYEGKAVGKCEHQYMGNDLTVIPQQLNVMINLENFRNRQNNKLYAIE